MKVKSRQYTTHTLTDNDNNEFELTHEPVEDTVDIQKQEDGGFIVRYLVRDDDAGSPVDRGDDAERGVIFLVNYHRDFDVRNDKFIRKEDLVNWYRETYDDYEEDGVVPDHIPQEEEYWIFPVACYVHSGVVLSLGNSRYFPDQQWDVSRVGAVLVKKGDDWPTEEKAEEAAEWLVEEWNQYLSDDVYGIVKETFDADRQQLDEESCWGFYGYEYAMEARLTDI